jgi:hypothetical protein
MEKKPSKGSNLDTLQALVKNAEMVRKNMPKYDPHFNECAFCP